MRRAALVMLGGTAAAAVAGAAALIVDLRRPQEAVGAMRGRRGSRVNTWMNRPVYRLVAEALELESDDELLDVGCGWGAFLVEHGSGVRFVAGIDLSEEKVRLARERLAERIAGGAAEVVRGDAEALPWEDGRFSAVTSIDAFQFFPDPVQALAEMRRVLRPGGRAVVAMGMNLPEAAGPREIPGFGSERPCDVRKVRDRMERMRSWTEPEVRRMMGAAGFEDVSISFGPTFGDNRFGNLISRVSLGTDESRQVRGVRALPGRPADGVRPGEAFAAG